MTDNLRRRSNLQETRIVKSSLRPFKTRRGVHIAATLGAISLGTCVALAVPADRGGGRDGGNGGAAGGTITLQPRMGEPIDGLTPDQFERFEKGHEQFIRNFDAEDGLGRCSTTSVARSATPPRSAGPAP
jgi:hypothetical protein